MGAAGKEAQRYAWARILKNQEKVGDIMNVANKPGPTHTNLSPKPELRQEKTSSADVQRNEVYINGYIFKDPR